MALKVNRVLIKKGLLNQQSLFLFHGILEKKEGIATLLLIFS